VALADRYRQKATQLVPALPDLAAANAALAETDPARALNVFGDDRAGPVNDPAVLAALFPTSSRMETALARSVEGKIGGALWETARGPIEGVIGYERREESVKFADDTPTGDGPIILLPQNGSDRVTRRIDSVYSELRLPAFGRRDRMRPYGRLEVQLAGRLDSYDDSGDTFNPQIAVLWQKAPDLALRASYSTGFKPGSVAELHAPLMQRFFQYQGTPPTDPLRGEPLPQVHAVVVGGNPELEPEKSESWNIGIVLSPAALGALTLSIDAFRTEYDNKIEALLPGDLLIPFPGRAIRGPGQGGLPGPVTAVDARLVNFSRVSTDGIDFKLTYRLDTRHGELDLIGRGTYVNSYKVKQGPTSPETDLVNTGFLRGQPQKLHANASLFWNRNAWDFGLTGRYVNAFTNDYLAFLEGATSPQRIRSNTEVDAQLSVDLAALQPAGAAHRLLGGTRLTVGIINVFDEAPPPINGDGGFAVSDPRMARYYLTLRKSY
jgi:iron complex outermembrane receptor protein